MPRVGPETTSRTAPAPGAPRRGDPAAAGLRHGGEEVEVVAGAVRLAGRLTVPDRPIGVVVFVHGSGSSRHSPRNGYVAGLLQGAGLATLLFDLLTPAEAAHRATVFDIGLLAGRLLQVLAWLRRQPGSRSLPLGLFGASTGAAAALWAAAEPGADVAAVVSRGGRPDLAGPRLGEVRAPTLLLVGSRDVDVLELNARAARRLRCEHRLAVVPGATHLFEEPGTLETAAHRARDWFVDHLSRAPGPTGERGDGADGDVPSAAPGS
ncbi:dienelactone hydrolase family protein [Geodermatophilus sp. SYSU D00710]